MAACRRVSGVVAIETTNAVQAGLRVQVLAFERRRGAFVVGEALTDDEGAFSIDLGGLSPDLAVAALGVRVLDGLLELTAHGDVRWPASSDATGLSICVAWPEACDPPVPEPPGQMGTGIHGRVVHADGTASPA